MDPPRLVEPQPAATMAPTEMASASRGRVRAIGQRYQEPFSLLDAAMISTRPIDFTAMAAPADIHRTVRTRLGDQGQRYTHGRQALVDALVRARGPVTLPALLQAKKSLPQSSAYRNLLLMEQAGVVRRLVHTTGHAHYELAEDLTSHHHHLVCENCGTIRDVDFGSRLEESLDRALKGVTTEAGFRPSHHSIDIYGECGDCSEGG